MNWGFDHFTSVALLRSGQPLPVQVQVRSGPNIQPVAASDLRVVLPKTDVGTVKLVYDVPPMVDGPIKTGDSLGRVVVNNQGQVLTEVVAISPVAFGLPSVQIGAGDMYNSAAPPVMPNQENQQDQ